MNIKQLFATILLLPIIILLFISLSSLYNIFSLIFYSLFIFLISYIIIRFIWVLGEPVNKDIKYKPIPYKLFKNGICPFCGHRKYSQKKLKIGYKKKYWEIHYRVFYIKYSTSFNQLDECINICSKCERRYLFYSKYKIFSLFSKNPSNKALKRKIGYTRGLRFPFEPWNIIE